MNTKTKGCEKVLELEENSKKLENLKEKTQSLGESL